MTLNRCAFFLIGIVALPATAAERLFEGLTVEQTKGLVLEALVGPADKTKCRIIGETASTLTASCEDGMLGAVLKGAITQVFSQFESREVRTEPQFVFVPTERGTKLLMQTFDANMYRSHGAVSRSKGMYDNVDQKYLNDLKAPRPQSVTVPATANAPVAPTVVAVAVPAPATVSAALPLAPAAESPVVTTAEPSPEFLKMMAELGKLQKAKKPTFEDIWEALPLSDPAEDRSEDVDKWAGRMKQPSAVAMAVGASGQMTLGTALGQSDQDVADAQALAKCNALAQAEGLATLCGVVFRSRQVDVEAFRQQVEVARMTDYRTWLANIEASLLKWDKALFE